MNIKEYQEAAARTLNYEHGHKTQGQLRLVNMAMGLVGESGIITIIFEKGKFVSAHFPFSGNYTRNGWRILAAISNEIDLIERESKFE